MRPACDPDLGDRLRRLALFADRVPAVHRVAVGLAVDRLALLLGDAVDHDDAFCSDDAQRRPRPTGALYLRATGGCDPT